MTAIVEILYLRNSKTYSSVPAYASVHTRYIHIDMKLRTCRWKGTSNWACACSAFLKCKDYWSSVPKVHFKVQRTSSNSSLFSRATGINFERIISFARNHCSNSVIIIELKANMILIFRIFRLTFFCSISHNKGLEEVLWMSASCIWY